MNIKIKGILRDMEVSLNEVLEDGYEAGKADQEIADIEKINEAYDRGAEAGYVDGKKDGYEEGKKKRRKK